MRIPVNEPSNLVVRRRNRTVHAYLVVQKTGESSRSYFFGNTATVELIVLFPEVSPGGFVAFLHWTDVGGHR